MAARSSTSASTAMALPPAFSIFALAACKLVGAARHQRDRGAVRGQHLGKAQAEPAGRAGHQRDAALEVEQFGGFHAHRPP